MDLCVTSLGTKQVNWLSLVRVAKDLVWDITNGLDVEVKDRNTRQDPRRMILLEAMIIICLNCLKQQQSILHFPLILISFEAKANNQLDQYDTLIWWG